MKGRSPDKPGTYRVRQAKGGGYRLSGVRTDGRRVRMGGLSEVEANELAAKLFPNVIKAAQTITQVTDQWEKTDDWGFPLRVGEETVASVAKAFNLRDPSDTAPSIASIPKPESTPSPDEVAKKEKRAKNAKSLMDMAGIAGAAGDVFIARRLCEAVNKEPVKPDPKQVNDLRDSIKETLTEMFGDKEIAPWQMMILLALGIPISMLIQSPRKKEISAEEKKAELKSVP